jgi:hypothetical protein
MAGGKRFLPGGRALPFPSLPDPSIYNLKEDAIGMSTRRPIGISNKNGDAQWRLSLFLGPMATRM